MKPAESQQKEFTVKTLKFRIKDKSSEKELIRISSSVNFVWNYINNLSFQNIKSYRRFLSSYDINYFLADGLSKELGVHSTTLQSISAMYVTNRKESRKRKLSWRTSKNLGWIPFKASAVKVYGDYITYNGKTFKFYRSRDVIGKILIGSFNQDTRGKWFLNLTVKIEKPSEKHIHEVQEAVGIDLGFKNKITVSDGMTYSRESITKKFSDKLAVAQRANKKRQVEKLSVKIENVRNDWTHKVTTEIAKRYSKIYVGDLEISDLVSSETKSRGFNKSAYDSCLYKIKNYLKYKAEKLGGFLRVIPEAYSTQTCHACFKLTGPKGEKGLSIREWVCSCCSSRNNRDVNAAKVILRFGQETPNQEAKPLGKGSPGLSRKDRSSNTVGIPRLL